MSIEGLIEHCLETELLFRVHPFLPIKPVRRIFVSKPIKDYLNSDDERAFGLLGDLDSFIAGEIITTSMVPREAREAYMGLLHPIADGLWDIRSRDPSPALRMLGGFSRRDTFVGLVLYERRLMGDFFSKEWKFAISECKRQWTHRFHALQPITGDDLHGYLSNFFSVD
jgi:hypothetical protein